MSKWVLGWVSFASCLLLFLLNILVRSREEGLKEERGKHKRRTTKEGQHRRMTGNKWQVHKREHNTKEENTKEDYRRQMSSEKRAQHKRGTTKEDEKRGTTTEGQQKRDDTETNVKCTKKKKVLNSLRWILGGWVRNLFLPSLSF